MEIKRDLSLDIAKGICIILMVIGHSGCPEWLNRFIYMFHMPCFFFMSGILLSEKYLIDVRGGIRKKLKGYYRPFVKWTLIFLFLHNVFALLHIYETSYTWRDFLALAFFMTGYLYRKVGLYQNEHQSRLFFLWLLIPAIASLYVYDLSMSSADSLSWLYYILAMAGIIGFIQFAKMLQNDKVAVVFNYIGNKTLYILTFHFLSFKLVSYAWIRYRDLPISNLAQFPVLEEANSWMWIIYSITGVTLPLLIWELLHLPIGNIIRGSEVDKPSMM